MRAVRVEVIGLEKLVRPYGPTRSAKSVVNDVNAKFCFPKSDESEHSNSEF